jgi:bacterioferritin-associated ferredoxin
MVVCHCEAVNDERIRAEVRSGARTLTEVVLGCRAGGMCGGCVPLVAEVVDDERERIVHLRSVDAA